MEITSHSIPSKEFLWLQEHYKELHNKYPGKIVAVVDNKIIGVGDTLVDVRRQTRNLTDRKPLFGRIRKKRAMIL